MNTHLWTRVMQMDIICIAFLYRFRPISEEEEQTLKASATSETRSRTRSQQKALWLIENTWGSKNNIQKKERKRKNHVNPHTSIHSTPMDVSATTNGTQHLIYYTNRSHLRTRFEMLKTHSKTFFKTISSIPDAKVNKGTGKYVWNICAQRQPKEKKKTPNKRTDKKQNKLTVNSSLYSANHWNYERFLG